MTEKKIELTPKQAAIILKKHNMWRRDNSDINKHHMQNPTQIGIAIDTVVDYVLNSLKK